MQNVKVFQAAQTCFPAGSKAAVAGEDAKLQAFLMDPDITMIQIVRDLTLHADDWQVIGRGFKSMCTRSSVGNRDPW